MREHESPDRVRTARPSGVAGTLLAVSAVLLAVVAAMEHGVAARALRAMKVDRNQLKIAAEAAS